MTENVCEIERGINRCCDCKHWTGAECGYAPPPHTKPAAVVRNEDAPFNLFTLAVPGAVIV